MDQSTTCCIIFGSVFGGGCLLGTICLFCICYEPNTVRARTTPIDEEFIMQKTRYDDLINKPPEYQAPEYEAHEYEEMADQHTIFTVLPPPPLYEQNEIE